jgi:hypothetical protein
VRAQNPYGHAAIRYSFRSEDGQGYEQHVMNVVGLATHPLINFLAPEDYLYGTPFGIAPQHHHTDITARAEGSRPRLAQWQETQRHPALNRQATHSYRLSLAIINILSF